jgi:hypothetical protein
MPALEILEQHGLEVYRVNAQHTKKLPADRGDSHRTTVVAAPR